MVMSEDRPTALRDFYRAFSGENARPVEPTHPYYVPILEQEPAKDPILKLQTRIEWEVSDSVSLLTGFRGNGKSTQLLRLRDLLQKRGCRVFLVDMLDYLITSKPLELSDFILSLMAALAEAIRGETGLDEIRKGYWERLRVFLYSEVRSDGITLKTGGDALSAELGLRLKTDPTFKDLLQQRLRGHLTTLVRDAQNFVAAIIDKLRAIENKPNLKVVLLVDSVEQIRGHGTEAEAVQRSVVETFSGQAPNLVFPKLHVVYTIPPYLLALAQNVGRSIGGHPITSWPNVHVRRPNGEDDPGGLNIMHQIVVRRYSGWERFFAREQLLHLARVSGGDLRDYFRLVLECLVMLNNSTEKKTSDAVLEQVQKQLQSEMTPIAMDDAKWLVRVHEQKDTALPSIGDLPRLARFLDSNLIMNYQNGDPWYDVHPLILPEIRKHLPKAG